MLCKRSNKDPKINDINYEFHANSPNEKCDEEIAFDSILSAASVSDSISDNSSGSTKPLGISEMKDIDDLSSMRKPRSENTDEIVPTSLLKFDPKHSPSSVVAEKRQNMPNADIQDIITGIVKLLNGNVNVHANTQYSPPPPTKRYATRINNRGPPRISDLPIIMSGIDDKYNNMPQKTTSYPNGMRKPPSTVPYPFDLPPPEKPNRNEHPMLQNKPIPTMRPPWHGSRTRPPIQISNTNRLQIPSRVSHLPTQPSQDLRPPDTTINQMTGYSTRIPDVNKMPEMLSHEKLVTNSSMEQMITKPINQQQADQYPKELTNKPDLPKKIAKIPASTSNPIIESSQTMPDMPEIPDNIQTPFSSSLSILEKSTQASNSPAPELAPAPTPFTHSQHTSMKSEQNIKTPALTEPSIQTTNKLSMEIKSTESIHTHIKSTILPSQVQKSSQSIIASTDFKSFYARPGIVLDDTDYTPGALEPSTQPNFHHIHRNTGAQSSATLSNIYAEVFDVTLSAIQGQPQHNKVVDLIEIGNTDPGDVIATKYHGNDIIVSASDDNSFVSIDGKRTYINLFGETAETEHLKKPLKTQNDHRVYASKTVCCMKKKNKYVLFTFFWKIIFIDTG